MDVEETGTFARPEVVAGRWAAGRQAGGRATPRPACPTLRSGGRMSNRFTRFSGNSFGGVEVVAPRSPPASPSLRASGSAAAPQPECLDDHGRAGFPGNLLRPSGA